MEKDFENNHAENSSECGYKSGPLPQCAPLALSYTPLQQENPPKYSTNEALYRGTLFPGLDLPLKNITNKGFPLEDTPLGELMAMDFVLDELELYLDTHQDDAEAFALYKRFLAIAEQGRKRYVELYGPVTQSDLGSAEDYSWLNDPWPWERMERQGK